MMHNICANRIKIKNVLLCFSCRAVNEARTRDPQLGKLVLYQLSYYRKLSRYRDSNPGPIHYE